jgi:D-xylose 1-dehydrogenase (NADP+, D-xylono-1,5-lactone-forming)
MINWGFLGAGWVATRALAPAVHEARNAKLLGVASRDLGRAAALVPEKTYDKYEDLLADSEIDAVYINLANHQHCEWTIAALAAGKHVLCEKPLALNYEQGQMMAKAAAKYDRILVEAVWNRWHPRFARIVELVNGGDIGAINRIDSSFCFPAQFENNYRLEVEMGGGSLLDVGIYQAHLWRALIHGEPQLNIESLIKNIGSTGVDLTTQLVGRLGNNIEISALSSFEMPETQKLVISGELATIECPGDDAFTSWNKPSSLRIGDHVQEFAPIDPYRLMIENVSAFILGESAWIPAIDQSLYVAKILDQIRAFDK